MCICAMSGAVMRGAALWGTVQSIALGCGCAAVHGAGLSQRLRVTQVKELETAHEAEKKELRE